MPGAFLWDDRVARALSLTAPSVEPVPSLPLSNLLDPQPRHRTRWLGSSAAVLVDFGTDTAIEAVALLSTSLRAGDTVRWRLGALEGLMEATPVFDLQLASPGTLSYPAGWAFNRASAGWHFDATGTLVEAAADAPRFDYNPATLACRGLLLEESRTNSIRNPRAEGAAPGTIPYLDLRIVGTASTTALLLARFETTTSIAAAAGDTWSMSMFVRLVGGSIAPGASGPILRIVEHSAGGSSLLNNDGPTLSPLPSADALRNQRHTYSATLTNADTATISPFLRMSWSAGAVVDMTLRLGLPQIEKGPCASSPILPPAGTPGTATRAADRTRITGLAIGAATLLVQCRSQGATGDTLIPGGYGPPDSYDSSSYLTVDAAGSCSWTARSAGVAYTPSAIAGSVNATVTLVGGAAIGGLVFNRGASQTTLAAPFPLPPGIWIG